MIVKLLILQLLAHLVSDFYLQTENSCKSKADNAFKSRHLYFHALITFACAWLFSMSLGYWWAALMIAMLHLVIDGLKSVCKNLKGAFFIDQLLHLAVIVAVVITFNNIGEISLPIWLPETKVLLWIVAFVFCLRPANFIIQNIFKEAKISIPDSGKEQSLPNAGRVIGNVERMLTLVFVMLGQYEAIGFLLAAKSLLRFRETDTVKSEYVLVGTLLSFGIAILMGVAVKLWIESNVIN
ncbi:MAG: DUF3307 domain-containing protein [Bacteroidales bacterium]|nr:DUF3307 domain-containing protein [Bacteroidales bacterium]